MRVCQFLGPCPSATEWTASVHTSHMYANHGVGWGGDVHVLGTCTHVLAFMFDVTEQVGLGLGWGGDVLVL